jgi:hypothetical protein
MGRARKQLKEIEDGRGIGPKISLLTLCRRRKTGPLREL